MEKQFFTYDSWNEIEPGKMSFVCCTLVQEIGNWKAGEVVPAIMMDYDNGLMVFYNDAGDELRKFELKLEIK